MIDCHTHLQPHGQAPPMTRERIEQYVEVALARGLTHVSFTEHLFRFQEAFDALFGWWDEDPDPALAKMAHEYWSDHVSGSVSDYVRTIEEPIADWLMAHRLQDQILYIVLTKGIPLRIDGTTGPGGVVGGQAVAAASNTETAPTIRKRRINTEFIESPTKISRRT